MRTDKNVWPGVSTLGESKRAYSIIPRSNLWLVLKVNLDESCRID